MQWLKDLISNWKLTAALVGGALVVGTVYGTCTFAPSEDETENVSDDQIEGAEEVSNTETTTGQETNAQTQEAE